MALDPTLIPQDLAQDATGATVDPTPRALGSNLVDDAILRGVRQSQGLGADYLGTVAGSAGQRQVADDLYSYADDKMAQAARLNAGAQTLGEIHGPGDLASFVVNKAAENVPSSAASVLGATTAGIAGAALPMFPLQAGETSYAMRHDPNSTASEAQRAAASTGVGVVNSLLEGATENRLVHGLTGIGPGKTVAGAVGRGAAEFGKNVGLEGLTEGLQDVTSNVAQHQFNPQVAYNPITDETARQSFLENAAAGAAGGSVHGAVGGVAHTLGSLPPVLAARAERARTPVDPNLPVTEQATQVLADDDRRSRSLEQLRQQVLSRDDLDPATREELENIVVDLDPDAQSRVAEVGDQLDTQDAMRREVDRLQPKGVKMSLRSPTAGFENVDALLKAGLDRSTLQDPLARQYLGTIEEYLADKDVDPAMIDGATDIFGARAYDVLRALAPDAKTRAAIDKDQAERGDFDAYLHQHLKPEYRDGEGNEDGIKPKEMRQLSNLLRERLTVTGEDVQPVLEQFFQDPAKVTQGLEAHLRGDLPRTKAGWGAKAEEGATDALDEEGGDDHEFGDTQGVQLGSHSYYGDTTGNRRVQVGGLKTPLPVERSDKAGIERLVNLARQRHPDAELQVVPFSDVLKESGVSLADAEAELGQGAGTRVLVRATQDEAGDAPVADRVIRKLTKDTVSVKKMNQDKLDPSAGAYIEADKDGQRYAIDLRRLVSSKTYGSRNFSDLHGALADGLAGVVAQGYQVRDIPADAVVAKYGDGKNTLVVRAGEIQKEATRADTADDVEQRQQETTKGQAIEVSDEVAAQLPPGTARAVTMKSPATDERGFVIPGAKPDEITVQRVSQDKAAQLIDRYAAQVMVASIAKRGGSAQVPPKFAALIKKHAGAAATVEGDTVTTTGEAFPDPINLGSLAKSGSPIDVLARGLSLSDGMRASLVALATNAAKAPGEVGKFWSRRLERQEDHAELRREAQEERQGTQMGNPDAAEQGMDEVDGKGNRIMRADRAVRSGVAIDEQGRSLGIEMRSPATDPTAYLAEQGVSELDTDRVPANLAEALGVDPKRDAKAPPVTRPKHQKVTVPWYDTVTTAKQAVMQQLYTLSPGKTGVPGRWAPVAARAAAGLPVRMAVDLPRGALEGKADQLVQAMTKRGFVVGSPVSITIERAELGTYSPEVVSQVLGADLASPVNLVLSHGSPKAGSVAALARDLGIPTLDLAAPEQARYAGVIARKAMDPKAAKAKPVPRDLDGLTAQPLPQNTDVQVTRAKAALANRIDTLLATSWNDPVKTEQLLQLGRVAFMADDDFFMAALEGKPMETLRRNADQLDSQLQSYLAERSQVTEEADAPNRFAEERERLANQINRELRRPGAPNQALLQLADVVQRADDSFFYANLDGQKLADLLPYTRALVEGLAVRDKSSARGQSGVEVTLDQADDIHDYIAKVLPAGVKIEISKKLKHASGIFREAVGQDAQGNPVLDRLITVSAYAGAPMSTAFHESMHALISVIRGQAGQSDFMRALTKASENPRIQARLRALLADEPGALSQLSDPEERIAYMYEFWASGMIDLTQDHSAAATWFGRMTRWVRQITGVLSNEQKAGLYMQAFKDGKLRRPSAVQSVVAKYRSGPERALAISPMLTKVNDAMTKVFATSHGRLKDYGNPALSRIADGFFVRGFEQGQNAGYLQTVREVTNLFGTQLANIIKPLDKNQLDLLGTHLHMGLRPSDAVVAQAYDANKALLRKIGNYLKGVGVEMGNVQDYFPQAWDRAAIADRTDDFVAMLQQNGQIQVAGKWVDMDASNAEEAAKTLLYGPGKLELTEDLAGFSPFMEASNERKIQLKDRAAAAEFMDHDIVRVMSRYVAQAAKRGEYTRHFGNNGERLKEMLEEAKRYGITQEEIERDVAPAIKAMEGTLGHDVDPGLKSVMSGLMTWQNLAVLPLSIFSSLIDPLGITVRGGSFADAWTAFKAGIRNIPESLKKNGDKLDIQVLAEDVGTVEDSFVLDLLGDMYGSVYMSDWARKTNNTLFKYNLMEGWNTAMRSAATVTAMKFIARHSGALPAASTLTTASGETTTLSGGTGLAKRQLPTKHSERFLSELGLKPQDIYLGADGQLLYRAQDLMGTGQFKDLKAATEHSRLVRSGIERWVDGAILRPHAADRPAWGSDPHWMLIWHLKQFTYSFQRTILDRVLHETRNGNYAPALALAAYVPFIMAADAARALLQGAGDEPDWRKRMSAEETLAEGVQRAGLLGVGQFGVDFAESPIYALGPTAGWAGKVADQGLTSAIVSALPGNALWKDW